jgi:hypothetical protein
MPSPCSALPCRFAWAAADTLAVIAALAIIGLPFFLVAALPFLGGL